MNETMRDEIEKVRMLKEIEETKAKVIPLLDNMDSRGYYHHRRNFPSWNIKVYQSDDSGHSGSNPVDKKYDKLWEAFIENREGFFFQCCEDGLGFVGDKKARWWDWTTGNEDVDKNLDYVLWQAGRSGGHLVLEEFKDSEFSEGALDEYRRILSQELSVEDDIENIEYALDEINGIPDFQELVIFCDSLDKFDASAEWNEQCNFRRSEAEWEWASSNFDAFDDDKLLDFLGDEEVPVDVRIAIAGYMREEVTKFAERIESAAP